MNLALRRANKAKAKSRTPKNNAETIGKEVFRTGDADEMRYEPFAVVLGRDEDGEVAASAASELLRADERAGQHTLPAMHFLSSRNRGGISGKTTPTSTDSPLAAAWGCLVYFW